MFQKLPKEERRGGGEEGKQTNETKQNKKIIIHRNCLEDVISSNSTSTCLKKVSDVPEV